MWAIVGRKSQIGWLSVATQVQRRRWVSAKAMICSAPSYIPAIHRELAFGMELATGKNFDSASHASAEEAYAIAVKFLTTIDDPAEVAALNLQSIQLRKAIDERVQARPV